MNDQGFIGSGSRFNSRFGSGEEITAKQLNDLSYGIQAGLPMPYIGEGPSVSYTPGGAIITQNVEFYQLAAEIDFPFKIRLESTATEGRFKIYVTPGTVCQLVPTMGGQTVDDLLIHQDSNGNPPYLEYTKNTTAYIVISVGTNDDTPATFPDPVVTSDYYPTIKKWTTMPVDNSSYGHILIGTIVNQQISQMISSSVSGVAYEYTNPEYRVEYQFWRM